MAADAGRLLETGTVQGTAVPSKALLHCILPFLILFCLGTAYLQTVQNGVPEHRIPSNCAKPRALVPHTFKLCKMACPGTAYLQIVQNGVPGYRIPSNCAKWRARAPHTFKLCKTACPGTAYLQTVQKACPGTAYLQTEQNSV